ncbi:MAG: hypothetical protein KDA31_12680 [Phycisphaerales bacterium]|nr:hypothetical protein [Phycisphaerales bacterium]MCB9836693.1 hypothetical protein [Phycisphaera sp.]
MAVIKKSEAVNAARNAVVLDLGDIARQAELLRRRAEEQAEAIVADAREQRERLVSTGYTEGHVEGSKKGYSEGFTKGEEEGKQESTAAARVKLDEIEKAWTEALDDFADRRHHLLVECKENVIRLALSIAERVIHRAVSLDERVVLAQVEHALKLIGRPTRVAVLINPEDGAMVRRALPSISARLGAIEHVVLEEDPSITRGGCVVRTAEGGEIDASLETQIGRIAQTLLPQISNDTDGESKSREDRAA